MRSFAACGVFLLATAGGMPAAVPDPGDDAGTIVARKAALREEYYRLIESDPEAAGRCRRDHAELVNRPPVKPPFVSFMMGSQWMGGLSEEQQIAAPLRGKTALHEAYRIMGEAGSDIVKISLSTRELAKQGHDVKGYETIDLAARHPYFKHVLDLPFRVMLLWAHGGREGWSSKAMTERQKEELFREIRGLTAFLLEHYRGSGKTFLIGNWEGDWMAGGMSAGDGNDLDPDRIDAFGDWLDVRTRAIDEAKAATPHDGVAVYSYLEVNHVDRARTKGRKRLVNTVLPRSRVDFVSVSSYEMQGYGKWRAPRTEAALQTLAIPNLDYVEAHLPPRDIPGKRVFIGEIGFTIDEILKKQKLSRTGAEVEQARLALIQAKVALQWGAPLWLWWSIFNSSDGKESFGLVDQATGRTSPLMGEFRTYYRWADTFTKSGNQSIGSLDQEAFRVAAIAQLDRQIARLDQQIAKRDRQIRQREREQAADY